jgi:hypothetical protein
LAGAAKRPGTPTLDLYEFGEEARLAQRAVAGALIPGLFLAGCFWSEVAMIEADWL